MRRSLFILASLALSSALYAQADSARFSREQVLEIFSQYNPSVLERAKADAEYNSVLETFLASYESAGTDADRFELIAVARNFDNSIRLQALTDVYRQSALTARMTGQDVSVPARLFREDLTDVIGRIWAVTVQLREYQLQEAKKHLKTVRADQTLSAEERAAQTQAVRDEIRALKAEIKTLKKDSGEFVRSAVDAYARQTEDSVAQEVNAVFSAAKDSALQSSETENLQIKSNHKKPVAK